MGKRMLMAATVPSMIGQFNMNNIYILLNLGYEIDIAADFTDTSVWPAKRTQKFKADMKALGINCIQLDFSRSPFKIHRHIRSYKETITLIKKRQYSFIHTHTPIASAIARLAAHKTGIKVIYTAHGFHFYQGAPLKNWIIFYSIEKWLSKYTDILITITQEDYKNAITRLHAKKTIYVPGVGVDTKKFKPCKKRREKIRTELGLSDTQIMILSVGELNENKNHEAVIRAIKGLNLVYVIVGNGKLYNHLQKVAVECGVDLRLTGYRNDVADFYNAADIYILPSIREGLNVSIMEAMASGLPITCGKIRGNTDLVSSPLFNPTHLNEIKTAIKKAIRCRTKLGQRNLEVIKRFDSHVVEALMKSIYKEKINIGE